jgi:hypothetical protein
MEYKYLLEERVNNNITFNDIVNEEGKCILNIICYNIETRYKYPFLQFMMEKVPYCNNIVKEQLIFPYIFIRKTQSNNIKDLVLEKIKTCLDILECENMSSEDMYKGIIFDNDRLTCYALVNITGKHICGLHFMRQTTTWVVLPSEIINNQQVLNIDIDENVIKLFTNVREIGQLLNNKTNKYYILPDVVYTCNKHKESEFKSIFGNIKTKIYDNCGEYYYFYRSIDNAIKNTVKNTVENKEWLNRYALFTEGKIYFEANKVFALNDEVIEYKFPEPCIIICYLSGDIVNPDILSKDTISSVCLSYHSIDIDIDKGVLDKYYIE